MNKRQKTRKKETEKVFSIDSKKERKKKEKK